MGQCEFMMEAHANFTEHFSHEMYDDTHEELEMDYDEWIEEGEHMFEYLFGHAQAFEDMKNMCGFHDDDEDHHDDWDEHFEEDHEDPNLWMEGEDHGTGEEVETYLRRLAKKGGLSRVGVKYNPCTSDNVRLWDFLAKGGSKYSPCNEYLAKLRSSNAAKTTDYDDENFGEDPFAAFGGMPDFWRDLSFWDEDWTDAHYEALERQEEWLEDHGFDPSNFWDDYAGYFDGIGEYGDPYDEYDEQDMGFY